MKIGILVVATKRYVDFVGQLWDSMRQHFFADGSADVTMYVHTDYEKPLTQQNGKYKLVQIPQDHLGWPFATLYRYRIFDRNRWTFIKECDHLYYLDADSKFVGPVGKEILGNHVATTHPGFWRHDHAPFSHERRSSSRAYVPEVQRKEYFCGGFQGGASTTYMMIAGHLATQIDLDIQDGIVAEWHDESHWNRWCTVMPPSLILPPEYCVPEEFAKDWPKPPKILALKKDHKAYRS